MVKPSGYGENSPATEGDNVTEKSVFFHEAEALLQLSPDELRVRVYRLRRWPITRSVDRIVPPLEAVERLADPALRDLVRLRAVVCVASGGALYPVRTLDLAWGEEAHSRALREGGVVLDLHRPPNPETGETTDDD